MQTRSLFTSLPRSAPSFSLLLYILLIPDVLFAQQFSSDELRQGYQHKKDTTTFIFSTEIYGLDLSPERVVVTGDFRDWNEDMDDPEWQLNREKGTWVLSIANPGFDVIPPSNQFKYRINEGEWLNPPADANNIEGGNLVFMPGLNPPGLHAELRDPFTIWADISGIDRSFSASDYRLTTTDGTQIPISGVLPNTAIATLISVENPINIRRVHYLSIPSQDLRTPVSFDGWFRRLYSHKKLGARVSEDNEKTVFRLFAPRAERVRLMLYGDKKGAAFDSTTMKMDVNGVWESEFAQNLQGTWYDFKVFGPKEPGSHYYDAIKQTISDPYSLVNDDAWGRSMVWQVEDSPSPLPNGIPDMEDVIAYEVHVQDFTDRLPIADSLRGTFTGMITPGLTNKNGEPIGFDHLKNLGINVVHLMPVQEYLHYPDDEWQASFSDDPFMQKHGIANENYQWGYRTTQALAVENRYRTKGSPHGTERREFRQLVQTFHENNMAVIIDIVPNHTGENMDGVNYYFNFNGIDKAYYYRTKNFEHIGAYGNEVKTENRPMVQQWLIDQCLHFINTFGVDGFRIDLAGQIDEQTLIALKKAIGEDKILYGEPWIASADPNYENNPDWDWYKEDSPITFFQDDARNAFKGPAFFDAETTNPVEQRGYTGGNSDERDNAMKALQNYFPHEDSPLDGINYLDIHDNWALADQFAESNWDGRKGVMEDRFKLAALLLFSSQGPIVLHGGTEMMRSKAHAELKETVKETVEGRKVYIHGKRDTYNMRVPNQFKWEHLGLEKGEDGSANNYAEMVEFWKDLIRFRSSSMGSIFRNKEKIPEDYYQFITPENKNLLGYFVDEQVAIFMNVGETRAAFDDMNFPDGSWMLAGSLDGIDEANGIKAKGSVPESITGGTILSISVEAKHFYMWVKK